MDIYPFFNELSGSYVVMVSVYIPLVNLSLIPLEKRLQNVYCCFMMCIFNLILILIVAPIIIGGAILAAVPSLPSLLPSLTKPDEIPPELILPLMPQLIQNIGRL
jgi:hypothetical protein